MWNNFDCVITELLHRVIGSALISLKIDSISVHLNNQSSWLLKNNLHFLLHSMASLIRALNVINMYKNNSQIKKYILTMNLIHKLFGKNLQIKVWQNNVDPTSDNDWQTKPSKNALFHCRVTYFLHQLWTTFFWWRVKICLKFNEIITQYETSSSIDFWISHSYN